MSIDDLLAPRRWRPDMVEKNCKHHSFTDVNGIEWDTITTPSFQFRMVHMQIKMDKSRDHGPTLVVLGRVNEQWKEMLKFDCYQSKFAHWPRCQPEGLDQLDLIYPEGQVGTYAQAIDFAMNKLQELGRLVAEQGFHELRTPERTAELTPVLPAVEQRMRELANDSVPRQLLTHLTQEELDRIMPAMLAMQNRYDLSYSDPID